MVGLITLCSDLAMKLPSKMGEWNHERRRMWFKLLIPLLCINYIPSVAAGGNGTASSRNARTDTYQFMNSKSVTFNSLNDRIGIDLDLTIPFLSIPLDPGQDTMGSLININAKALTIAGIFTVVSTLVVPLLTDSPALPHYRRDEASDDGWNYGETMKQVLLGNSYLAPCTKKFICSVVSDANHAKVQSSFDKIIDGISSHEWFDQMAEGSAIHEAVVAGRKSRDNCNAVYSGCFLSKKFYGSYPDPIVPS